MTEPGIPHIVAIGGFDPTGGAGLVRDHTSARAIGAGIELIVTAVTDRRGFEARPIPLLVASLRAALTAAPRRRSAVKIGMVATPDHARAIAAALAGFSGPVVFDPVLTASSGVPLLVGAGDDPARSLEPLLRAATVITPNAVEAARLLRSAEPITTIDGARIAARALRDLGAGAVLLKGGHLDGDPADVLSDKDGEHVLPGVRIPGVSPRGTGCALAVAIATALARGTSLQRACEQAKEWLAAEIAAAGAVGGEVHLPG